MSDLPEGTDFLIAAYIFFFGPQFVDTFNCRCNFSHFYVFVTDIYWLISYLQNYAHGYVQLLF